MLTRSGAPLPKGRLSSEVVPRHDAAYWPDHMTLGQDQPNVSFVGRGEPLGVPTGSCGLPDHFAEIAAEAEQLAADIALEGAALPGVPWAVELLVEEPVDLDQTLDCVVRRIPGDVQCVRHLISHRSQVWNEIFVARRVAHSVHTWMLNAHGMWMLLVGGTLALGAARDRADAAELRLLGIGSALALALAVNDAVAAPAPIYRSDLIFESALAAGWTAAIAADAGGR